MSSSIACLPMITRPGCSASTIAFCILRRRGAPRSGRSSMHAAVRAHGEAGADRLGCALRAIETTTISVAPPFSLMRIASSTAISSKGFMLILTLARSTPEPSA